MSFRLILIVVLLAIVLVFGWQGGSTYLNRTQTMFNAHVDHSQQLSNLRLEMLELNKWQEEYLRATTEKERYYARRQALQAVENISLLQADALMHQCKKCKVSDLNKNAKRIQQLIDLHQKILKKADMSQDYDVALLDYRALYDIIDYMTESLIKNSIIEANRHNTEKLIQLIIVLLAGFLVALVASFALWINIDQRKKAQKLLKKTQSYLNNVVNSMPSMLVGVDINGRVLNVNRESQVMCNCEPGCCEGKLLVEVFPQLAEYADELAETIKQRRVMEKTKLAFRINGKQRNVNITAYPLVTNGIEGAVVRVDDVTRKVRMEEMMLQTEKMMSLGGLAAGVAHEVNNPLAAMLQTSQVMKERLTRSDLSANVQEAEALGTNMEAISTFMERRRIFEMLKAIHDAGVRVSSIVKNMLSFARKSTDNFVETSPKEIIQRTIELATVDYNIKEHYDFRTIEIVKVFEEPLPQVPCNMGLIQQVILNILKNAAQALHAKIQADPNFNTPTIKILARQDKHANGVLIQISDNGPGMDSETRQRLFEPFYTTKETGVGTGLGMSVSYFIVKDTHGGDLTVESEVGRGTTFNILLPLKRAYHE